MKENEYQLVMRLKVKKNLKKLLVLGLSCRQKVEKTHTIHNELKCIIC